MEAQGWELVDLYYLYQAKYSFIEAQNILQKAMVIGDDPIGIPDEGVVDLVERWLRIVDRALFLYLFE